MDYRERRSCVRGVYPTQGISRMKTVRVEQEEEADKRRANAEILTIKLPEGRETRTIDQTIKLTNSIN